MNVAPGTTLVETSTGAEVGIILETGVVEVVETGTVVGGKVVEVVGIADVTGNEEVVGVVEMDVEVEVLEGRVVVI